MGTESRGDKEQRALFGPHLVVDRPAPTAASSLAAAPKLKLIAEVVSDERRQFTTAVQPVDVKALNQALLRTVKFF